MLRRMGSKLCANDIKAAMQEHGMSLAEWQAAVQERTGYIIAIDWRLIKKATCVKAA